MVAIALALKFTHLKILPSEASFTCLKILAKSPLAGTFYVILTQAKVI